LPIAALTGRVYLTEEDPRCFPEFIPTFYSSPPNAQWTQKCYIQRRNLHPNIECIYEYRYSVQNFIFLVAPVFTATPNAGYKKIVKHSALSALHNSRDRSNLPKLYKGTRDSIFQSLKRWTNLRPYGQESASSTSKIMWICGAAGAGKSAVCQSLAEWCSEQGLVLASFFFDRLDNNRNHEGFLIPTLAYQIARGIPVVREHLNRAVDHDPAIFKQSFEDQINVLLFGPLKAAAKSARHLENQGTTQIIILVDGLDECECSEIQRKIVTGLCELVHSAAQYVPIRLLLSSRPQPAIANTFQTLGIEYETLTLHGDYADVRRFLVKSLEHIKRTHPFKEHIAPSWPTDGDIETLVAKSSGHFLYAADCLEYIRWEKDIPSRRLEVVLGMQPARGNNGPPFVQVDALYTHILRTAEYSADALRILALVLVAEDFSLQSVVSKLDLTIHDGAIFLADLASIVQVEHDDIRLLQASFQDFLFDEKRSGCFHIPASLKHAEHACRLLGIAASFVGQGQERKTTICAILELLAKHEILRTRRNPTRTCYVRASHKASMPLAGNARSASSIENCIS
jgi:hypothetical protein